jgi:hypothetical protein
MGSKRTPQTAAKREREQLLRERRLRKQEKRQAVAEARKAPEPPADPHGEQP